MRLTVFALLLALSACAVPSDPPPGPPAATSQNCVAAGGEWRPVCKAQRPVCVRTYQDAGKICTDSSQCDGRCRGDYAAPPPPDDGPYVGYCEHDSDPCGCSAEVVGGELQSTRCVD